MLLGWAADRTGLKNQLWGDLIQSSFHGGFPGSSGGKESACQCRRHGFNPWVRKIPWRREWQPTLVSLPGEAHGGRSLEGHSPWGGRELDTTESLTLSLEVQMIKNLSALQETWVYPWVWKIPWRRKWQSTPVFFPGEFHGHSSQAGYNPWGGRIPDNGFSSGHV